MNLVMPTPDQYRLIASLRPRLSRPAVEAALHAVGISAGSPDGAAEPAWRVSFEDGAVNIVVANADFPPDVPLAGLSIGMTEEALRASRPDLIAATSSDPLEASFRYLIKADPLADARVTTERGRVVQIALWAPGVVERNLAFLAEVESVGREQQAKRERAEAWRRESDPDRMLDVWAGAANFWDESADRFVRYSHWLRTVGPAKWHAAADVWNWDYGTAPLRWIVAQPTCERATALMIFYAGEPDHTRKEPTDEDELLALIRHRWQTSGFADGVISFVLPRSIARLSPDRLADRIPLSMRVSIAGERAPSINLDDGVPAFLHET